MSLSEVLNEYNRDFVVIEYRQIRSIDSDDVGLTTGFARYKNKMLQSLDDAPHHLSDEIKNHELFRDDWLIVWYE